MLKGSDFTKNNSLKLKLNNSKIRITRMSSNHQKKEQRTKVQNETIFKKTLSLQSETMDKTDHKSEIKNLPTLKQITDWKKNNQQDKYKLKLINNYNLSGQENKKTAPDKRSAAKQQIEGFGSIQGVFNIKKFLIKIQKQKLSNSPIDQSTKCSTKNNRQVCCFILRELFAQFSICLNSRQLEKLHFRQLISFIEEQYKNSKNNSRLSFCKSLINEKIYIQNVSSGQYLELKQIVKEYRDQKATLDEKISKLKVFLKLQMIQYEEKSQMMVELKKKKEQLQKTVEQLYQKREEIRKKVTEQRTNLTQIQAEKQKIFTFVNTQEEKKLLQWVSQAYKKIQDEIYAYALELHWNAMASSLTWQPKPFRAVENLIMVDMENLSKSIVRVEQPLNEKLKKMSDFIVNTTRKYRTKDQQMMKVVDFKTNCIKTFISKMQRWLQNYDLKQEYLNRLRTEYTVESCQIKKLMPKLIQSCCQPVNIKELLSDIQKLDGHFKKIDENYKCGNSFY